MTIDEIKQRFHTHDLDAKQREDCAVLRQKYEMLADAVLARTPQSREQSLALTQLEQSAFWAIASIARH
jgi:hypothetical protein